MKAIILAAGQGTRLGEIGKLRPKCLIDIGGKSLLQRSLDILSELGINSISIVLGTKGPCWNQKNYESIKNLCSGIIYNFDNDVTHSTYSVFLAFNEVDIDEDLILIDGDIFYSKETIQKVIDSKKSTLVVAEINQENKNGTQVNSNTNNNRQVCET